MTGRVLLSEAAGLAVGLGLYLAFTPDRKVADVIAGTAGTVFALIVGAGVPLLYSLADRSIAYWTEEYFKRDQKEYLRRKIGKRGPDALEILVRQFGIVVLAALHLLVAVMLSITVSYATSITGTPQRAILATAFGLMAVGLLLTLFFVLDAVRIREIRRLQDMLRKPPPPKASVAEPTRNDTEPTQNDIDRLVASATPHFAFQLRARVAELIDPLPANDPVHLYGLEKMEFLERLGYASSNPEEGLREPRTSPGWENMPSSSPIASPNRPADEFG